MATRREHRWSGRSRSSRQPHDDVCLAASAAAPTQSERGSHLERISTHPALLHRPSNESEGVVSRHATREAIGRITIRERSGPPLILQRRWVRKPAPRRRKPLRRGEHEPSIPSLVPPRLPAPQTYTHCPQCPSFLSDRDCVVSRVSHAVSISGRRLGCTTGT